MDVGIFRAGRGTDLARFPSAVNLVEAMGRAIGEFTGRREARGRLPARRRRREPPQPRSAAAGGRGTPGRPRGADCCARGEEMTAAAVAEMQAATPISISSTDQAAVEGAEVIAELQPLADLGNAILADYRVRGVPPDKATRLALALVPLILAVGIGRDAAGAPVGPELEYWSLARPLARLCLARRRARRAKERRCQRPSRLGRRSREQRNPKLCFARSSVPAISPRTKPTPVQLL